MLSETPEKRLAKADKVARILDLTKQRTYQLARENVFPPGVVVRIGRQIRFNEDALKDWIAQGGSALSSSGDQEGVRCGAAT